MYTYLAIIIKVGFENILNILWIGGVNLIPEGPNQPVGLVLGSKISHVIMQPFEVEQLVKDCASNWWIPPLSLGQFPC